MEDTRGSNQTTRIGQWEEAARLNDRPHSVDRRHRNQRRHWAFVLVRPDNTVKGSAKRRPRLNWYLRWELALV
jgi:hypothetical protein